MFLVTSNEHKLQDFHRSGLNIPIQRGDDLPEVLADHKTVAVYKALMAGEGAIVEDTILFVDGKEVVNIRFVLGTALGNGEILPAKWVSTLAHNDGENLVMFRGEVDGTIRYNPEAVGFGFDPHFIPNGETQTLTEMGEVKKDKHSARMKAIQKLKDGECDEVVSILDIQVWDGGWQ